MSEWVGSRRQVKLLVRIGDGEYVREWRMNDKGRYETSQRARSKSVAVAIRYIYAEVEEMRPPGINRVMRGLRAVSVCA